MMFRLVTFLSLAFVCLNSFGQKFTGFSGKASQYPTEVKLMFGNDIQKDEEELIGNFSVDWRNNVYDSIQKKKIIAFSNLMYDRKSRKTQFKQLITLLTAFKESKDSSGNYQVWLDYMPVFVEARKTSVGVLSTFLENLTNLVKSDLVFMTNATQWKYTGGDHVFKVENDVLYVIFPQGMLKCYSKRDSIAIDATSGRWSPTGNKWLGANGIVTWERAGYDKNEVFAKLSKYTIELNKTEYKADTVAFTYGKYFKQPVLGKLTDMVMDLQGSSSATYPQFETYGKRFYFKNLYPDVDYDGGFSMRGAKIIGSGSEDQLALITVKKKDSVLMEVKSKYFVFRPDRVNGIKTAVKIHLGPDSIFHSSLSFLYTVDKQEVSLIRTENFDSQSPYNDSYHRLDMDFEQLNWRITEPRISLTMSRASTIGKAKFQSQNYYNQPQFEEIQGRDSYHPLVELRRYARMMGSNTFPATNFIDYIKKPLSQGRQVLMSVAQKGFIYYNTDNDMVTIKQRLIDYLKSAAGTVDYDVVNFNSTTQAPLDNAILDMDTKDLIINGIPRIAVSDSQNVAIYPAHDQIVMKQNRSFQFDGKVEAGLFTVYGSNFFFDYDRFKINLQNVDSVTVMVYSGEYDNIGRPATKRVTSVIQHLTGELQIDKPDNKSGLKNYPQYPLFASREKSYVYYQSKDIENGVYPEESFYFELYPFTIDSLDNFKKEGLTFKGKFQSSGILPPIEQELVLQPDYSLGFKFNPGPNGIPVYGGKGTLFGDIQLSHKGLRSDGKLRYVTSTTLSKDFKFYPDSMNTQSDAFTVDKELVGTQFPKAAATNNYIHWATGIFNEMTIKQGKALFNMFNEKTSLAGDLRLNPKGLTGKGMMNLTSADLHSNLFKYKAEIIDADTSKFLLKSLKKEGYTVLTEENVSSHIDFTVQKGEFQSNEDYTRVDFPENKYISYLDFFKWNMDQHTLEMSARRTKPTATFKREDKAKFEEKFRYEEEPEGPRYISVNNKQDSLNFVSPAAVYDYQNNHINATNVKLIRVADAIIYPGDGKVTVEEGALMRTLYKAKVVANVNDKFHTLYDADLNVQGRKSFTGSGKYDYVDENEKIQTIKMTEIKVDDAIHTLANGNILEPDSFMLSPYFAYQGKVKLNSTKPLLDFDGGVAIKVDCGRLRPTWLRFETEIDPKNILIPVSDAPVSINNRPLYNGIFIAPDSIHVYPAFLSGRHGYNDAFITTSSGFLRYNKDSSVYEIASLEKFQNRDSVGNYLSLNKFNCTEFGESPINLGANLGQMKISSFGTAAMNAVSKDVELNISLNVDFLFDETALHSMASKIDSFPNLQGADINDPLLMKAWANTLTRRRAERYKDEMTLYGKPKEFPKELIHTISFTQLRLKWDAATKSYQSYGKIGVGNILNYQVNKSLEGFVQITRKRSGDLMDIYLKLDDNNYYYFGYSRGVMQAYATYPDFLEILRKVPLKARQISVKSNETPYTYMVTSSSRFGNFMRDYKNVLKRREQKEQQLPVDEPEVTPEEDNQPVVVPEQENAPGQVDNSQKPKEEVKDKVEDKDKDKDKEEKKIKEPEKKEPEKKEPEKPKPAQEEKPSEGDVIEVK